MPEINKDREAGCQSNPENTPGKGFFHAHHTRIAVKHAQVEQKHQGYKNVEANPEVERVRHSEIRVSELLLTPAFAALPLLPQSKCLQLLVEFCLPHQILHLRAVLPRAESIWQIGNSER